MRIAVDAKLLAQPGSSIARYTRTLLTHMIAKGHQWMLYSEYPFDTRFAESPRVLTRFGNLEQGRVTRIRRTLFSFRRWAMQDVADLFWSPMHYLPLNLPSRMARVVTVHDMVWRQYPETMPWNHRWVTRALMGPSLRSADRVISLSRFTASEMFRHYPEAIGKCRVVHSGVNPMVDAIQPALPLPERYLLSVGTPEPRKNLPRLLRALARLREDARVPPLVIVGSDGKGHEALNRLIVGLGLEGRVILAGVLDEARLQWMYRNASALVMPSLYEGFGLPALEAMQHGLPVVAASTGSLPEVIGGAGLMVNPFSEPDIADAIRRLMHDSDLQASLSAKSLKRAENYSWQLAAVETLDLFQEAFDHHEPKAYRHRVRETDSGQ